MNQGTLPRFLRRQPHEYDFVAFCSRAGADECGMELPHPSPE